MGWTFSDEFSITIIDGKSKMGLEQVWQPLTLQVMVKTSLRFSGSPASTRAAGTHLPPGTGRAPVSEHGTTLQGADGP